MTPDEQRERLFEYVRSDTVLFPAPSPDALNAEQKKKWQPVLDAHNAKGASFSMTADLRPPVLSAGTEAYLARRLSAVKDDRIGAFAELAGAYKSVLLALSVVDGELSAEDAFDLSVLEELYQNKLWGEDADALTARQNRKNAAVKAAEKLKEEANG